MDCRLINWRRHALERMFERNISRKEVKETLAIGKIIEVYNEDKPFPSKLILAFIDKKPIHVVVAYDNKTQECYVITAYIPTEDSFYNNFVTRRK